MLASALATVLAFASTPAPATTAGPFSDWAAVVIAGDWHANSGGPTEAFDNARRDIAAQLPAMGFSAANIRQFSTRPDRYPDTRPMRTELGPIYETLSELANKAPGGCLVYYTSHGGPPGVVLDQDGEQMLVPPEVMADLIDQACPNRPSVVVISACFSGVFIPALRKNDRMVITAARKDRSSFGCSEDDKYPYFDECFLRATGTTSDFARLADAVRACVAAREAETGARPPSEPQVWIGPAIRPMLPLYTFRNSGLTATAP